MHNKLIEYWRLKSNERAEDFPWKITDALYKQNIDKVIFILLKFNFVINSLIF